MSSTDDLPPALPAMWRALKRGYEAEPLLLSVAFGLALLAALPDALLALWFKLLADGVLRSEEHTSELQSLAYLVCRLLLEKKKNKYKKQETQCRSKNMTHHPDQILTSSFLSIRCEVIVGNVSSEGL